MKINFAPTILVLAAGLSLAACNKSPADAQADAVRDTTNAEAASTEQKADVIENQGEAVGGVTEDRAEATADAMRDKAEAITDRGEMKADAIEDGKVGVTTKTDSATTTTTAPVKK